MIDFCLILEVSNVHDYSRSKDSALVPKCTMMQRPKSFFSSILKLETFLDTSENSFFFQ